MRLVEVTVNVSSEDKRASGEKFGPGGKSPHLRGGLKQIGGGPLTGSVCPTAVEQAGHLKLEKTHKHRMGVKSATSRVGP